ncbi:MAG: four helix bundle protein [Bacteroidaceae bacterium]|nr:four helix bundle protein [Bacteroidaceae bacterium]
MENEDNIVLSKAEAYAIRIIKLYRYLQKEKNEKIMSNQLLRCGTSVGANLTESNDSISHAEFIAKTQIALKECSESLYWLKLLVSTEYITQIQYESIFSDGKDIQRLLIAILKSAKTNPRNW